jgi:ABC-type phosphate/phosphonate transport system permease subunit
MAQTDVATKEDIKKMSLQERIAYRIKMRATRAWLMLMALIGTIFALTVTAAPVAADMINTTQVDEMFDVVNNHIIPQAAGTIGALPALIIPLAFLLVILAIVFFIPDILYEFLDVIKGAIGGKRKP